MAGNTNSSQRSASLLPVILEEETMMSSPANTPLQRTPGSVLVHSMSDDEDDEEIPGLNTNANRHSENNNSDDSAGSDGDAEKVKAVYGPKNLDMREVKQSELEDIPESEELMVKAPTWDTMLAQLNKLPGDAILLLADVRAVMLAQSHWKFPYPEALGHVLLAWQMLRSGCYTKDCRVWLRKKYKHRPFKAKQQPFTAMFGIAGFCIRKRRLAPEEDNLDTEHRDERLQNNLIEYTGYTGLKGRKVIRRINSKKDERTERYKGKEWDDLDKVVVRWDNTGYHTSGSVQINLEQEMDCGTGNLRRHCSLPSNSQRRNYEAEETHVFTVADCLKPGSKNLSPPNKRIKRHNSDSSLCPGKASQMWMDYNRRRSSEVPADKTSSDDLTKEELWNRAMAEVNDQNVTSSNNSETIGEKEVKEEEEERPPSPAASVASADWSVGSQQSSDSCSDGNCNCVHCGRELEASPRFYAHNTPSDQGSIPEVIEQEDVVEKAATQTSLSTAAAVATAAAKVGTPTRLEHKMKNSLTLSSDQSNEGSCVSEAEFVSVNAEHVMLQIDENSCCSGDSVDGDFVKVSPCSNSSEGFAPSDRDILKGKIDRVDM